MSSDTPPAVVYHEQQQQQQQQQHEDLHTVSCHSSIDIDLTQCTEDDHDHHHHHHHHHVHFDDETLGSEDHHSESSTAKARTPDAVHGDASHHQDELGSQDFLKQCFINETEVVFQGLTHCIEGDGESGGGGRRILDDISGYASPGQILAVMGPSGSGKTTLLNALSGRVKPSDAGVITLNGHRMCKQFKRKMCYVLQQDIFFPTLTLKQTLMYAARLRLPDTMRKKDKASLVDKLIEEMQLQNCQNTMIGDTSRRGLSGGEKKRVNIACELLTNPSIMLIDEPTSGLDSCTAHSLIQILKSYAIKKKKTIVMTIHQPSSQMFYAFDRLLLLSNGKCAYFGRTSEVMPFFNSIGFVISLHYNPADFILEKVKCAKSEAKLIEAAKRLGKFEHTETGWRKKATNYETIKLAQIAEKQTSGGAQHNHSQASHTTHSLYANIVNDTDSGRSSWSEPDQSSLFSSQSLFRDELCARASAKMRVNGNRAAKAAKWPTSMWTQVVVLTERNFIDSRARMLSKVNWIQTVVLAIVAGLIWYQVPRREDRLDDIRGWMFFTTTYWMLFGLFQALVSFPPEREVINKERSSGAYRLSSYYLAKMIGELPLTLTLPSVFFVVSYPLMGVTSASCFLWLWLYLVVATLCAQSIGLFIGALCQDLEVSMTISALYSLSTMLFAGFYTAMPPWLSWMRYLSMVYYAFLNMQLVEFGGQDNILQSAARFVSQRQVIQNLDTMAPNVDPFPLWLNTLILFAFFAIFRILGYVSLRFSNRKAGN